LHCGSHTGPAEPIDCGGARLCAARILADASGYAIIPLVHTHP
jgi:hypothetical protein